MSTPQMLNIVCQDGVKIQLERNVALMMGKLRKVLGTAGARRNGKNAPIKLGGINSGEFSIVLVWCKHYREHPPTLPQPLTFANIVLPEWDKNLLNVEKDIFLGVIMAANLLEVPVLSKRCSKIVFDETNNKPEHEIEKYFNVAKHIVRQHR